MQAFEYNIKLLDHLFYAREGLSAAYTPPYLHATAVNLAVNAALNIAPDAQPLILSDENGGQNVPRYKNSLVSEQFYFTPARIVGAISYQAEVTKGENDGYTIVTSPNLAQKGFRGKGAGELFRAETLNYLTPESMFEGFLIIRDELSENVPVFPEEFLIRLGTFRGKARIKLRPLKSLRPLREPGTASHPVDPLVSSVRRGVAVNMFPYPVVDNCTVHHGIWCLKSGSGFEQIIALPDQWALPESTRLGTKAPTTIV
jgi:CRISPR type I-D-associated protein Csc1